MGRLDAFLASMVMDFDKWHDGTGYAIELLDDMTPEERDQAQTTLLGRAFDWRELEALDRLGTPAAIAAILQARTSSDVNLRLAACKYGPPDDEVRERAIVAALKLDAIPLGVFDDAAELPTAGVIDALWKCAERCVEVEGYQAAITLLCISGKVDSTYSMAYRPLCLRFTEAADRPEALAALRKAIGSTPKRDGPNTRNESESLTPDDAV